MKLINREEYLTKLIELKGTPDIKIITGIRRSGKSELIKAYMEYLSTDFYNNVIYIDFTDVNNVSYKNYLKLNKYIESKYLKDKKNILIIDEVQPCKKFELTINILHASKKYDIYLIGSNAFLLNGNLATLFTGRYIEIPVFPFSYKEYLKYYELENSKESFDKYLIEGGMSGVYLYPNEEHKRAYIKDVYNTILKRDLIDKYNLSNSSLLFTISDYLMDNISNFTTSNNITNVLKNNKFETNHNTVGDYIDRLCAAFVFYKFKRYDVKGKKYLKTNDKYYLVDHSFRLYLNGKRNFDYGRIYENIVAIELLRRGYDVYIGKVYEKEIDFIALKGNEKMYIQVSDDITRKETLERELSSLKSVGDSYPKILLANTNHDDYDIDGIKVINIANWLLK